jgi:serine/threonine protein kinase
MFRLHSHCIRATKALTGLILLAAFLLAAPSELARFSAILVFPEHVAHAGPAATEAIEPLARIYDGNKLFGEVLKYGPELGDGHFGVVQKVTLRDPHGNIREVALKIFKNSVQVDTAKRIHNGWASLRPIYEMDHRGVLNYGVAGLKLVPAGTNHNAESTKVILSSLSDGSVQSRWLDFLPILKKATFDAKISMILNYQRDVLQGIALLSSHGLAHGDLKPANVLYTLKPGFDWKAPEPSLLHFTVTDFDSVTPIGEINPFSSAAYSPPERLLGKNKQASAAWDIYSHAVSVYQLLFRSRPFDDYFDVRHGDEAPTGKFDAERYVAFANAHRYDDFLEHVDERFKKLEAQVTNQDTLNRIHELHHFVLNGLKLSPEKRLSAFPQIEAGIKRHFEDSGRCKDLPQRHEKILRH